MCGDSPIPIKSVSGTHYLATRQTLSDATRQPLSDDRAYTYRPRAIKTTLPTIPEGCNRAVS